MKREALHPTDELSFETPSEPDALRGRRGTQPFVMIDGFNLGLEKGTGVATYARNLSFTLRDLGCEVGVLYGGSYTAARSSLLQEVAFYDPPSDSMGPYRRAWRHLRTVLTPNYNRAFQVPMTGAVVSQPFAARLPYYDSIWNATDLFHKASWQFHVLGLINRVSVDRTPDLCHWTYPLPLMVPGVPNVYTLHDLVPLRLPYTTLDKKERYLRLMKWICRQAAHIVTVSEHSKRDIVELLGVDPQKVTNTYQAVRIPEKDRLKSDELVQREVENTFGLTYKEYFLFFGSIEPKKNIGRLIEGYLGSGVTAPLVIIGAQAWRSDQELRLLQADVLRGKLRRRKGAQRIGKIVQLEYAPYSMLISLIRGAKAVLFPSLYEGFGLPILESMLLGTPVLSSRVSSVPEVAGDAALLINPYEARDIGDGIRALDADERLRAELSERGRVRAQAFSEANYRQTLTAVYDQVLTSHVR